MPEYGVTLNGVNIKRSDTIQAEIHAALSAGWNVNTRNNPQSFLNVMITDFADKLAELWMFGSGIYYSMYPSSAEGTNLDNAVQYAGITRKMAEKSYYPIHCKGIDGTVLPEGTRLASISNPVNYFSIVQESTITREKFNAVAVKLQSVVASTSYTVVINGISYSVSSGADPDEDDILTALAAAITDTLNFTITADTENHLLLIEAIDPNSVNSLALSSHLTTEYVVTIIQFASEESGDIDQPDNTITQIATAVTGLNEVTNIGGYQPGRQIETDTELRQSYLRKIFHLGSRMADSVASVLLNDVTGVDSVSVFENDTDYTTLTYTCVGDETGDYFFVSDSIYYLFTMPTISEGDQLVFSTETKKLTLGTTEISTAISLTEPTGTSLDMVSGIWPHSIECVIDGGEDAAIAKTILEAKAAGINTFGEVEVQTADSLGNMVPIRFTRPTDVFVWFNCEITASTTEAMPSNYVSLIRAIIIEKMGEIDAGGFVSPQKWLQDIFSTVSGIAYMEINMATEASDTESPMTITCTGLENGAYYLRYCEDYYVYHLNDSGGTSVVDGDTLTFSPSNNGITLKLNGTTDVPLAVSDVQPVGTDMRSAYMAAYTLKNYQTTTRERPRIKDQAMIGVTIVG